MTINNILFNINIQVVLNLFVYVFVTAASGTLAYKLIVLGAQKALDIMHQRWLIRFQDKRNLALDVIKICNEGSVTGWNVKPRDMEHVYFIARLLRLKDENASKFFDLCISRWSLIAIKQESTTATKENIEFCLKLQKEAQDACEGLMKIVGGWG